jgi:hypothetical protein
LPELELPRREVSPEPRTSGLKLFAILILSLAALSVLLAFLPIPQAVVPFAHLVVSVIYVAVPVYAIYNAGNYDWKPALAIAFIIFGVSIHLGLTFLADEFGGKGVFAAVFMALAQSGLLLWCVGLGALLATLLKEKNLLIPVSIFLAAFDIFLVLTPAGPVQTVMRTRPEVFEKIAWVVPKVEETPTLGPVAVTARMGPADLVFMGMFFIALFRFRMKTRETALWLAPLLVAYLAIAMFVYPHLPALVPIGLCVLIVNWTEFRLTKQEWASTSLVALLCAGLIAWGMTRPTPPAEPLPPEGVPAPQAPGGLPAPAVPGPRSS